MSGATGVATPFIVAYEQPFGDVDRAERLIHAVLERKVSREAKNREFFRATAAEVIKIVLEIASTHTELGREETGQIYSTLEPWAELLEEAALRLNDENGAGSNVHEGIRLYEAAARMGSAEACRDLGQLYFYGQQVKENHAKALEWYQEAANRGAFDCHIWMARIHARHNARERALQCFKIFFEKFEKNSREGKIIPGDWVWLTEQYLHICLDHNLPIEYPDFIEDARANILGRVEPRLEDGEYPNFCVRGV